MGTQFSYYFIEEEAAMAEQHEISRFEQLPEGCISHIISLTSPKDACRSTTLSTIFKSAADSNTVWEQFLPIDYQHIISRVSNNFSLTFSSKKQLYIHLCKSYILLDSSNKLSFHLSKASGKKCYMLCSRELEIAHGDHSNYWKWTTMPQSRFTEVAELYGVWWLEIRGKIKVDILSHDTTYAAYLIFQHKELRSRWNHNFYHPVKSFIRLASNVDEDIRVELNDIEDKGTFVYLENPNEDGSGRRGRLSDETMPGGRYPQKRLDGWMEIELGVPFNSSDQNLSSVEIIFWETGSYTGGLIVEGIELRVVE